jgi:hypothetical protein
MRKISLIFCCFFCLNILLAQDVETVGMQNELNNLAKTGVGLSASIPTYSSGNVDGSQFFFPTWSPGSVTTTSNETIDNKYLFLFDKLRQELFIKPKKGEQILLMKKEQIHSFMIFASKQHFFEPVSNYDSSRKTGFFEVLVKSDQGYTLLKFVKTEFVKSDMHDMQKVKSGNFNDAFVDELSYYVSYKNEPPLRKIELKEKSIKKALTEKKDVVQKYFQQNGDKELNEQFFIDIFKEVNN